MLIVHLFPLFLLLCCDDVGHLAERTSKESWESAEQRSELLRSEQELTALDSLVERYLADHCESIAAYREHIGAGEIGVEEGDRYFDSLTDCHSAESMGAALYIAMHRDQVKQVVRAIHDYSERASRLEEHIASINEQLSHSEARE